MDKNKIKEALKKKLKQEMSMTGTGASVTPGVGAGVATKYAFGKRDNKGTPSDWKEAPSIPNRKSKAMDYKELWEEPYDKSKIKTNTDELARVEDYYKEATSSQKSSAEDRIKKLKILVSLEKKHNTQLPVLTYGTYWVDYLKKQGVKSAQELDTKLSTKKEDINENYARFRNETKTRTKPEQFHSAVKDIKKKVNEINRLFEYMNRLQSELSESEGGLKYKKYTEKSIQQIKESTKQLFFKSTKLK
jgi:hypothetical protein